MTPREGDDVVIHSAVGRSLTGMVTTAGVLSYPIIVYYGLTTVGPRAVGGLLFLLALPVLIGSLRRVEGAARWALLQAPTAVAVLAALSFVIGDRRYLLALPTLVNASLLVSFATSLATPHSIVERYARLEGEDRRSPRVRYCRSVTVVWCVFFALNGLAAAALALWAPYAWWALFTGAISYVLMGLMFAGEFVVRHLRFGRWDAASAAAPPRTAGRLTLAAHRVERAAGGERHVFAVDVPADLPYFPGHFPGQPILPGVAQLHDVVLAGVQAVRPELPGLRRVTRLKFRRPIRPGDRLELRLEPVGEAAIDFAIVRGSETCASGRLAFGDARAG